MLKNIKLFKLTAILLIVFAMLFQISSDRRILAATFDATDYITDVELTTASGAPLTSVTEGYSFRLKYHLALPDDVPGQAKHFSAGDSIEIDLPPGLVLRPIPTDLSSIKVEHMGQIKELAVVTGRVVDDNSSINGFTLTFTPLIEELAFQREFTLQVVVRHILSVSEDTPTTITFPTVNGSVSKTITVTNYTAPVGSDEIGNYVAGVDKWGYYDDNYGEGLIRWEVRVNMGHLPLTNGVLLDVVGPGHEIVSSSSVPQLRPAVSTGYYNKNGYFINNDDYPSRNNYVAYVNDQTPYDYKLTFPSSNSIKLEFGDLANEKGLWLSYYTRITDGGFSGNYGNTVTLQDYQGVKPNDSKNVVVTSYGFGGKASDSSLTVSKVDENGQPLIGASFEIYHPSYATPIYTFTIEDDQPLIIRNLPYLLDSEADYRIVEVSAPEGYLIGDEVTFRLSATNNTTKYVERIIENEPIPLVTHTVTKVWEGSGEVKPNIQLQLQRKLVTDTTFEDYRTIVTLASPNLTHTWNDLYEVDSNGVNYEYRVVEITPTDYLASYVYSVDGLSTTITNKYNIIDLSGTKTWDDANNQDGKRPEEIELILMANGDVVNAQPTWTKSGNEWTYVYVGLPKYAAGSLIDYTIDEVTVDGYASEVTGLNITNTYTPEVTTISGTKTWLDNNDATGIRPKSLRITLFVDGVASELLPTWVKNGNVWTYTFDNLAMYKEGVVINYTVQEETVAGYNQSQNGYNFTNTVKPGKVLPITGIQQTYYGEITVLSGLGLIVLGIFRKKRKSKV